MTSDVPATRHSTIFVGNPSTPVERLDEALRQAQAELGDTGAPVNIRIGEFGTAAGPESAMMTWPFSYEVQLFDVE